MKQSPLTPLSANTHRLSPCPESPSRLPQKSSVPQSPSKLKLQSSPYMSFSPVVPSKASRANSPVKQEMDDDVDLFHDGVGDDSMCSNFSDFTVGQYGTASQGLDKLMDNGNLNTLRKSPVKSRPQTPVNSNRQAKPTVTAPNTARPLSYNNKLPSDDSPVSSPHTPTTGNQTTNLMDFTAQFDAISRPNFQPPYSHNRPKSVSPTKVVLPPSTPTESRFFNLLDFTPGPVATPRSIPSITPREVEEIKSGFNSQISQLKARLNGSEVEVSGLRSAVQESEERRGELSHSMKELQNKFEDERNDWVKVKVEMGELFEAEKLEKESILNLLTDKERVVDNLHIELEKKGEEITNLKKRLRGSEDELERTREEVLRLRTEKASAPAPEAVIPADVPVNTTLEATQLEVERVARELHALYRTKHETKVAALKKSYENRWEKKVHSQQEEIVELSKKNAEMMKELEEKRAEELSADISFSVAHPITDEDLRRKVLELEKELVNERAEKEGIVNLVEELLAIQSSAPPDQVEEKMRGSIRRTSGMHGIRAGASGLRSGIEKMGMGARRDAPGN